MLLHVLFNYVTTIRNETIHQNLRTMSNILSFFVGDLKKSNKGLRKIQKQ